MKPLLLFLPLLLLTSCQDENPTASAEDLTGYTLEKIPGSSFQRAYKLEGERLIEEGQVQNGQKNGTWISYHGDQKNFPKIVATYVNGKRSGPYMEFNKYGQFLRVAHYQDDQLHGRLARYEFTRLQEEIHYKNGELDGPYTLYYERSDSKQRTAEFKNGVEHGWVRYFNEEGALTMEYEYRNGEKVSGGIVEPEQE